MIYRTITSIFFATIATIAMAQTEIPDSVQMQDDNMVVGRPYKSFDATAFCSYLRFHPSHYLTDNNWDIL